jgi:hypothetical protein
MLDIILRSIARKLEVHLEEVRSQRSEVERERASGQPRTIATAILKHPEGYATSPREAAQSAQKAYAKARREWEQQGIPMLTKLATLIIARERRDETAAVLREHEETEATRKATKVHPAFRRLNDIMIAHGVETGHAATATDGVIAIVSDILMWAGADPDLLDPDSPLHALLETYAGRLILTPGQFGAASRSKPGVPVRQVKYTDPEYYMFNEAAQTGVDVTAGTKLEPAVSSKAVDDDDDAARPASHGITCGQKCDSKGEDAPVAAARVAVPVIPIMSGAAPPAVSQPITPDDARRIAEAVFDTNPYKMGIYWPRGVERDDYELARLIPALEQWVASGEAWGGASNFLAAARLGEAREFIREERELGVRYFARRLLEGDERALKEVREAGLLR